MGDAFPVIWDFDGTLLPSTPHDSEQALILALAAGGAGTRPLVKRLATPLLVEADRRQWFCTDRRRRIYLKAYAWLLEGTPAAFLDTLARDLARRISTADRRALARLRRAGHPMAVVSCGTADLSERILRLAGVDTCFEWVAGNRLRFHSGAVAGMQIRLLDAGSKVRCVARRGIDLGRSAVVGDGYTDLPLLERAGIPIMMDPDGAKRPLFDSRGYHFSRSVAEAAEILSDRRRAFG